MAMMLPDLSLPAHLAIMTATPCPDGETNEVFACEVVENGRPASGYLKLNKQANLSLRNERNVLRHLSGRDFPVPRVMAFVESPREALLTEALPGRMIWDFLDPRRAGHRPGAAAPLLEKYGKCLGQIHSLAIDWTPQVRGFLYRIERADFPNDARTRELMDWVERNALYRSGNFDRVFVHGDLNIGSVLIQAGEVSGVVDWEFAGLGWREYDLAWILRARTAFLHTPDEREAILHGYRQLASFDPEALQLAEVMNYLRFSKWTPTERGREFFLGRAEAAAGS